MTETNELYPWPNADYMTTVWDDSMSPCIQPGDRVLIRRQDVTPGDLIAVTIDGNDVLRRYIEGNDHVTLAPFNPRYESIIFAGDAQSDFQVIGVVVALVRSLEGGKPDAQA